MPTEPRTFAESVDEAETSGRLVVANQSLRALPSFAAIADFITDISELGGCGVCDMQCGCVAIVCRGCALGYFEM